VTFGVMKVFNSTNKILMKDPLLFKRADLIAQIVIPGFAFVSSGLLLTFFVLGVVQVVSCIKNRRVFDPACKVKGRRYYERTLIIFGIFIGFLGTIACIKNSADIGRFMILIIGLVSPFFAYDYFSITLRELKKVKETEGHRQHS
jgi:hypothetical protein